MQNDLDKEVLCKFVMRFYTLLCFVSASCLRVIGQREGVSAKYWDETYAA